MGLHSRLFRSSSLFKFRHNFATSIINPFHHNIPKQCLRLHHDNATYEAPRKFIVRIRPHKYYYEDADNYLSLLTFNGRYFSPENNFYFHSPIAPVPDYPFSVIGDTNGNDIVLPTEVFHPPYNIRLVNSCNGLICLQGDTRDGKVVIWNPLIDEFKVLDYSPVKRPRFASHTCFKCAGFGFDHKSKDCKALMRVENFYENKFVDGISMEYINGGPDGLYEVCSLKTGSWWDLPEPQYEPSIFPGDSVYMDGFCYWKAQTHDDRHLILGFDFADDIFFVFPGPLTIPPMAMPPHNFSLLEYMGLLGFVLHTGYGFEKNSELWVREKNGTWSKVDGFRGYYTEKALACWSDKWFFQGIRDDQWRIQLRTWGYNCISKM